MPYSIPGTIAIVILVILVLVVIVSVSAPSTAYGAWVCTSSCRSSSGW